MNSLLGQITLPLLPVEPSLSPDIRRSVEQDVVEFVGAQINGMPVYLRWPYKLAIEGFNWMSVRQYGRRYTKLDPVKKKDYVAVWIHSTLSFKRDFIKLIRSCALLRFYDHPLVIKA
ncbi:MAG: hypothetical protein V1791_15645, partial [Pseudomonadota bacterium]